MLGLLLRQPRSLLLVGLVALLLLMRLLCLLPSTYRQLSMQASMRLKWWPRHTMLLRCEGCKKAHGLKLAGH